MIYVEAGDEKRVRIKSNEEDPPNESQGLEWTSLPSLAPDLNDGLGLKLLPACKLNST